MILKNIIPTTVLASLVTYISNLFVPKFISTNTASGTDTVTLNTKSGIATFAVIVSTKTIQKLTLANSYITTSSFVSLEMLCADVCAGAPIITYGVLRSGEMDIYIYNASDADSTDRDLQIWFSIQ
jgi:hypothetical protein